MSYNNKYEFKANEVTERLITWTMAPTLRL